MDYSTKELPKFEDERGFLIEFLKNSELADDKKVFGQIYLTTIRPGCVRGNHYHLHKEEHFALMSGRALVIVEDVDTKERREVELDASGERILKIRVGPGVAHAIKNTDDRDVVLCSYTNEEYDPDNLDQLFYELI